MRFTTVISAACLLTAAQALLRDLPRATAATADNAINGFSPKTTDGPRWELMKRQASSASGSITGTATGYLAPDNTCGYISGSIGAFYTCAGTAQCGGFVDNQIKSRPGACCDYNGGCRFNDACIPYAKLSASCDHACMIDVNTRKCSLSQSPYCYTYQIATLGLTFFACDAQVPSTADIMSTTFFGQTNAKAWQTLDLGASTASSASAFLLSSSKAAASSTSSASSASSASLAAANNSASSSSSSSSTPIGAIVGGVVGGLAVIVAIIGIIVFACLRKRKNRNQAVVAPAQYGPPGSNMSPPPGGQPMMYAPGGASMAGGAAGYYSQDAQHKPTHDSLYKPNAAVVTESALPNQHYGQQPTSPIPSMTSPAPPYQQPQFNNGAPNELPNNVAVPPAGYAQVPSQSPGRLSGAVSPVEHGSFPNGYMPSGNPQPGPYHPPTTNASGQPVYELRGQQ